MAGDLINLEQLRITVTKVKEYTNKTFADIHHIHDDIYASFNYVDSAIATLEEKINEKAVKEHAHNSNDITRMVDYVIATDESDITDSDSLNTAIGKLEYRINNISVAEHDHDGVYLKYSDTAAAAKKLEKSIKVDLVGGITGSGSFDGSSDLTIDTTLSELSSNAITSMQGYTKPDSTTSIFNTDSLNEAIGKLEAALDLKLDISGALDSGVIKSYVDEEISKIIGGSDIPDSLNTLREIASAINDDPDFADTINKELEKKANITHPHNLATDTENGFMSSDDKTKLNDIEEGANNYIHPNTSGFNHIPSGGEQGQMLAWLDDGVAQWVSYTPSSASDSEVESLLDSVFPLNF